MSPDSKRPPASAEGLRMSAMSRLCRVVFFGGLESHPVALGVLLGKGQVIVRKVRPPFSNQPIDKGVECEVPQTKLGVFVVTPDAVALN